MTGLKMNLLGEYSTLLYDEEMLPAEKYLEGVDKRTLLKVASFMIGLDINSSKLYNWKELLHMWFKPENYTFKNKIWQRCLELEKKYNARVSLISPAASLRFFEFVFSMPESEVFQNAVESEVNLFKAYLLFVSNTTSNETVSKEYVENLGGKLRIAATMLNQVYPLSDFTNYDLAQVFVTQIIKAGYLFQFLESHPDTQNLLQAFYKYFNLAGWREYFQFIVPLIEAHSKHPNEGWTEVNVVRNEKFEKSCFFLESLALKDYDPDLSPDFKMLRGNPIYKVDEGHYAIISPLFVVEKIFKGLYFKLREIHDTVPESLKRIKNFRSFYTTNFSEKFLLYKILEHIYGGKSYITFSGEQLSYDGSPDYYVRNGNHLFLFENKDVFINAEVKQSFDFRLVEKEFEKKFYFENKEGKIDPKAVLQIASNVEKALMYQNKFDSNYNAQNLKIYPILVLHDASFNSPGLNFLINHWFEKELSKIKAKGVDIKKVKPITIVNIDTLILYADFIRMKKVSLNDLIDGYIKASTFNEKNKYKDFEHLKVAYGKSLLSFSFFIDQFTKAGFHSVSNNLRQKTMEEIFPSG